MNTSTASTAPTAPAASSVQTSSAPAVALPRVAIACQGGGAHTAFTAGALAYLFLACEHFRATLPAMPFRIGGLSGTSGGAITAAMAWSQTHPAHGGDHDDNWAEGAARVLRYWNRNKATLDPRDKSPLWWGDYLMNLGTQWSMAAQELLPLKNPPPSAFVSSLVQSRMKEDMRKSLGLAPHAEHFHGRPGVDLYVGAVDVVNPASSPQAAFRAFPEWPAEGVRMDELLASACIPELFVAGPLVVNKTAGVEGERVQRYFWDGLYSQNPPISNFFAGKKRDEKPDLLWVIQINPDHYEGRDTGPQTPRQQEDRRNELAGNLSLGQELRALDTLNKVARDLDKLRKELAQLKKHNGELPEAHKFKPVPGLPTALQPYKQVAVNFIRLGSRTTGPLAEFELDYASKLNRDPAFIDALMADGIQQAFEAARAGKLGRSSRHMRVSIRFPKLQQLDWPSPAQLGERLADPELRAQWARLCAAL